MNEIKYVKGDLFDHIGLIKQKIGIAHVCNDIGHWGAGFSGVLSKHYPLAEVSYRQSYAHPNLENSVGDVFELGGGRLRRGGTESDGLRLQHDSPVWDCADAQRLFSSNSIWCISVCYAHGS